MKAFKICAAVLLAAAAAVSCSRQARIDCTVNAAPGSQVVVKLLDINTYKVLDTLRTDERGRVSYKMPVAEAQPEFVYLFYGDTKIASAVVLPSDRISIEADTLGHYTVSGSAESELLQGVEQDFSAFMGRMTAALDSDAPLEGVNKEVSALYVDYYRNSVKYVISHPYSITSVPVCFHKVNENLPVFNQTTDALHFRNLVDSLSTVYPESKYVKALAKEADKRTNAMEIVAGLRGARELGFPDLTLPDTHGQKVSLSEVDAKVILVHFWSASDNEHKLINNDILMPLYNEFHDRGMEVYAVAIDTDKSTWASTVKNQKLPWINVCDGLGAASPAVRSYALSSLPATFVIAGGEITTENVSDMTRLRAFLQKTLK